MFKSIRDEFINTLSDIKPIMHMNFKEAKDYTNQKDVESCIKKLKLINNNDIIITLGGDGFAYYCHKENSIKYIKYNYES
ncbi:hypothetical protein SLITO_v1c01940 [Spiroplasma litorale]|uniref:Uncharacterized protein n=1 Tax=Spiroplasma litorale TaxID=216942 RepID=A0A0K1W115_9MOLU|nr:hypothetical protein [Spiroplasma litorale]AKX33858.1 hypothetical protein SLITO_v1c01940 [Spiroplasma litorale]